MPYVLLLAGMALLFAASCVLLVSTGSLWSLTVAVGLLGVAVAPQMITMFGLAERTVPAVRLGEAMAALVSALILAQSAGTFLGGWATTHFAPAAPFAITAATAAALLLAACTATEQRYRRRTPTAPTAPTDGGTDGGTDGSGVQPRIAAPARRAPRT
ncbi:MULTISPECIES: MFS transporter [unclassified Kitasatospora]|uniref:MFS transporter n=1 Tax=unclassified Kitasatospora TaxID=2633591 RepID=UPI00382FB769